MSSRNDRYSSQEKPLFSRADYRKSENKRSNAISTDESWKTVRRFHHNADEAENLESNDQRFSANQSVDANDGHSYYYEKSTRQKKQDTPSSSPLYSSNRASRRSYHEKLASEAKEASYVQEQYEDNSSNYVSLPDDNLYYESDNQEFDAFDKAPKKSKKMKKKKRKRRGCGCFTFILLLFLSIIIYCVGFFIKGQNDAKKEPSTVTAQTFNGQTSSSGAKNILLIGSDSRDGENARADTIMVLSFDGKNQTPKIISIMRDSYVDIPGSGKNKINAAYSIGNMDTDGKGGAELLRKTIEKSLDLPLKYYVTVDFHAFEKVIAALYPEGVEINAEKDMDLDGVFIKKGQQVMDAHTLLQYARFRHDPEGDFGRIRRQQQVMSAVLSKLKSPISILRFPYAAGKAIGYTANDIPLSFYYTIAKGMLKGSHNIQRQSVPIDKSWNFSYTSRGESIIDYDDEMNAKAIKAFLEK